MAEYFYKTTLLSAIKENCAKNIHKYSVQLLPVALRERFTKTKDKSHKLKVEIKTKDKSHKTKVNKG